MLLHQPTAFKRTLLPRGWAGSLAHLKFVITTIHSISTPETLQNLSTTTTVVLSCHTRGHPTLPTAYTDFQVVVTQSEPLFLLISRGCWTLISVQFGFVSLSGTLIHAKKKIPCLEAS